MLYARTVDKVTSCNEGHGLDVVLEGGSRLCARRVIDCAYAQIDALRNSGLPPVPLKHKESSELPLVHVPPALKGLRA